jgi:hypothetical protein
MTTRRVRARFEAARGSVRERTPRQVGWASSPEAVLQATPERKRRPIDPWSREPHRIGLAPAWRQSLAVRPVRPVPVLALPARLRVARASRLPPVQCALVPGEAAGRDVPVAAGVSGRLRPILQ